MSNRAVFTDELRLAAGRLPGGPAGWIRRALKSEWFPIQAGSYQGLDGSMCPAAAGATMAGLWHRGRLRAGHPEWGLPEGPSEPIEDFAAYFDLCAEELGSAEAMAIALEALEGHAPALGHGLGAEAA